MGSHRAGASVCGASDGQGSDEWRGVPSARPPYSLRRSPLNWSRETSDCRQLTVGSELRGDAEGGPEATRATPGQATDTQWCESRHRKEWRKSVIRHHGGAGAERKLVLAVQARSPRPQCCGPCCLPRAPRRHGPRPSLRSLSWSYGCSCQPNSVV